MANTAGTNQLRDRIDPLRLYDPRIPAGRFIFLWGLAIYPFIVLFVLMTAAIMIVEAVTPSANVGDYLGIVTYVFMLGWVAAIVAICRRRLLQLQMSPQWVWVAILPVVSLILFVYLLFKSDPVTSSPIA